MKRILRLLPILLFAGAASAAEVDTITVKDADNVTREVPTLLSVEAYIDQLEGYLDQVEGYIDGLESHVDGIEALIGTTNTSLASLVDALFDYDSGGGTDNILGVAPRIPASGGSAAVTSQAAGADDVSNTFNAFISSSFAYYYDGSTWDRVRGDSTNGLLVNLGTNNDVTVAAIGNTNDSACVSDTGDCSSIALAKRQNQRLTTLIGSLGGTGTIGSDFPASATASGIAAGAGSVTGTPDLKQLIGCDSSVAISTASSGNTELVALTSGMTVYVCGYMIVGDGDVDVQIIYGTGTACATGETDLTGAMPIASSGGGMAESSSFWRGMKSAASNALCIELSAAVQVSGILYYTKF